MATKRKTEQKSVDIVRQKLTRMTVRIKGVSPLIHNRFSSRSKQQMADKQGGKAKKGKEARDPNQEYLDSLIVHKPGKTKASTVYGVRAVWFKLGMLDVAKEDKMGSKVRRNVRIGHTFDPEETLPIKCGKGDPHIRIGDDGLQGDRTRLASGVTSISYRGEFSKWEVDVPIEFNSTRVSEEQVLAWLEEAGRACGAGDWRPQRNGQCGMYEIAK